MNELYTKIMPLGTWRVVLPVYRLDRENGNRHQKRGFPTKRDALAWERRTIVKAGFQAGYDISQASMKSMQRIKRQRI